MSVKEVVIGDVSDAWLVGPKDAQGVAIALDGFTCQIAVIGKESGTEIFRRAVTGTIDGRFLVYLDVSENSQLEVNKHYTVVWELENLSLPKPFKKEGSRTIRAVAGLIN